MNATYRSQTSSPPGSSSRESDRWSGVAALVQAAQEGDRQAFGALVEQFERTVYAVALNRLGNTNEAAELSQEVFLHALRRIGQLRDPERFAGWIRQMTDRMAINRATRRAPLPSLEQEILETATHRCSAPVDTLIRDERAQGVRSALANLKPIDRDALVAFYMDGDTLVEMAQRWDVPIGTVKRRLHTARKRMKLALEASVEAEEEWTDVSFEEHCRSGEPLLACAGI